MRSLMIAAILSGSAIAAHAGDMDAPQDTPDVAPVEEATSWAGFYGGLSYSSVSGGLNENTATFIYPDLNRSGAAGAFIGYNWQNNNLVYGAELNHTAVDTNLVGYPNSFQQDVTEIRGRLGYTPANDLLVYGFLGYASTRINDSGIIVDQTGVSYGVGMDYMVWNNTFVGLELARRDVSGTIGASTDTAGTEIDTVSLRVGYKF